MTCRHRHERGHRRWSGGDDGAAGPRRTGRLHRDPANGIAFGVCAGLADYFGVRVRLVRVAVILGLVFFTPVTAVGYLALAVLLPPDPGPAVADETEDGRFWRGMRTEPSATFSGLRHRYRVLENRLRTLEAFVTRPDVRLAREIDELGKRDSKG